MLSQEDIGKYNNIAVVIPVYEPEKGLVKFIEQIAFYFTKIIIVDDGNDEVYSDIFSAIGKIKGVTVLKNAVNCGKGRSLKNAFNYVLNEYPDLVGVVTANQDGKHSIENIISVADAMHSSDKAFIMGCRNFKDKEIPLKTRIGNTISKLLCSFLCGIKVSDTQTSLRGIPTGFLKTIIQTPGERYDYEMNMLLECSGEIEIVEVPISADYKSIDYKNTHFKPLRDSFTIYKVILAYSLSSVLTTLIDFIIFTIVTYLGQKVWVATALARVVAGFLNFLLNRKVVFKSAGNAWKQLVRYTLLLVLSGSLSALSITYLCKVIPISPVVVKIFVEAVLFLFNYYVQRTFIFIKRKGGELDNSLFSEEITEKTDWQRYYYRKKSWFSTATQKYTLRYIVNSINEYSDHGERVSICELGGGNSCFAKDVCNTVNPIKYDIIDNNAMAVSLFNKLELKTDEYKGVCLDLLTDEVNPESKYKFVYSIGLIEHFRGKDIRTIVDHHFDYCEEGGIVLISFPTPTKKYIFNRKIMELFGVWQFHDEKPLKYDDVREMFEANGEVLDHFMNKKIPLTQEIVITRKRNNLDYH